MDREGNVVDVLGLKGKQGANGTTPHIGENGNWFIGDTDTGVPAKGEGGGSGGGSGGGILAETDPTVFVWAKSHLPFTVAQLSAMASGAGLVVNPTNFADGKTYFRYHAGATSFTWTNPNPQRGAVTITVLAWSQYGDKTAANAFSALNIVYGDGTTGRLSLVNGQTVTMTTDANKVLAEIRGNYDHENWVLLDMSVTSLVADYPAPGSNAVGGLSDTAKTLLITILRNGVYTSDQSANITALETALGESGDVVVIYAVVNNLTNVTTNNTAESLENGNAYTATLTADDGYTLDYVKVTMGGKDVTSTVYSDGVINISDVTGNLVITAAASVSVSNDIMQIGDTLYITGGVTASLTENVLSVA